MNPIPKTAQTKTKNKTNIDWAEKNRKEENNAIPGAYGGTLLEENIEEKIFVMNNHRLAYSCWKMHFDPEPHSKILMLHIDRHPDAVPSEYVIDDIPAERDSEKISWFTNKYLKCDNFIHPYIYEYATKIRYINLCHKEQLSDSLSNECVPDGLEMTNTTDAEKVFEKIKKDESNVVLTDLDLDYFTDWMKENELLKSWENERISDFMEKLCDSLFGKTVEIITVATSPYYLDTITEEKGDIRLKQAGRILNVVRPFLQAVTGKKTKEYSA